MQLKTIIGGFAVIVLITVMGYKNGAAKTQDPVADSRIQRGFEIAPVTLNLEGKNRSNVGLGSYFVNAAGGCNDCHTCPTYEEGVQHNPFIGGDGKINSSRHLAGGLPFAVGPETIRSANLTPDGNGLPAGLTFQEFKNTIRTGHEPEDPEEILQVMPWPVFRNLTDHDLLAIYTYLTAIPSRNTPPVGSCSFPGEGTFPPP